MAAKSFLNGSREGRVTLYNSDQYPYGAIGPVSFLWRQELSAPVLENNQEEIIDAVKKQKLDEKLVETDKSENASQEVVSRLWVWAHPACFQEVFDAITAACQSVGTTAVIRDKAPDQQAAISTACSKRNEGKCAESIPHADSDTSRDQMNCGSGMFTVSSRRFDLLRLRLCGPQSHGLLVATLKLADLESDNFGNEREGKNSDCLSDEKTAVKDVHGTSNAKYVSSWWRSVSTGSNNISKKLWNTLEQVSSPSVLPPGCAVGLTVLDPRLDLPGKKTSVNAAVGRISSSGKKNALSNLEQFYCSMPLIEFERYWSQIVLKVFNKIFSSGLITTLDM